MLQQISWGSNPTGTGRRFGLYSPSVAERANERQTNYDLHASLLGSQQGQGQDGSGNYVASSYDIVDTRSNTDRDGYGPGGGYPLGNTHSKSHNLNTT